MTPLVCVHGFMGGSVQWEPQRALADGRDLISLDLPGFGARADEPPLDRIEAFASFVLDYLTDRGVDRFDLLGHSMGGMIVQEIARSAPQRIVNLILYATGSQGVLPGRFEPIETSMRRAKTDGAKATARRISATWFAAGEAAEAYPACAEIAEHARLSAILAGLDAMQHWSGRDQLGDIHARTLVIWGDGDRTYKWPQIETLWKNIPACALAVVPGCAHAVHLEKPAIFNAIIADFLANT